jgi:hypothetical protein
VLFCRCGFCYRLLYFEFKRFYCGASAAIIILVAVDLSALNECTFADRNIKLWHITAVILILDLMQFRLDNTVDTSLTWQVLFLVFFYSITAKGIDLSEIVTGVISFY